MKYPTFNKIEESTHLQLCEWYTFLPMPINDTHRKKIAKIKLKLYTFKDWHPDFTIHTHPLYQNWNFNKN